MKETLLGPLGLFACTGISVSEQTYKTGDTGPAGGIVFYDKGFNKDGWRYLEAAPAGTKFKAQWGPGDKDVAGTEERVGSGKRNTQLIISALGKNGEAAYQCANLNFNGYNDWFLPSKDELDLICNSLVRIGLGGFTSNIDYTYWSSSQGVTTFAAWVQRFSDGSQVNYDKYVPYSVLPVRTF